MKPGRLVEMNAHTGVLREAHLPPTRTQVRSFVGMRTDFYPFGPSSDCTVASFSDLIESSAAFVMPPATALLQQAFD